VVAQIVQAIYNVVDRLYIGHGVNEAALAGLTLTFPFMMILTSFGTLIGVGTGALVSIKLGEGCKEEAEKLLGQMVLVKIIFFVA
jgi:Na+-driven multidrug efflux pump